MLLKLTQSSPSKSWQEPRGHLVILILQMKKQTQKGYMTCPRWLSQLDAGPGPEPKDDNVDAVMAVLTVQGDILCLIPSAGNLVTKCNLNKEKPGSCLVIFHPWVSPAGLESGGGAGGLNGERPLIFLMSLRFLKNVSPLSPLVSFLTLSLLLSLTVSSPVFVSVVTACFFPPPASFPCSEPSL